MKKNRFPIKTILVPIDFSASSKEALPYAAQFALSHQATIILMHVVELQIYNLLAEGAVSPGHVTFAEQATRQMGLLARTELPKEIRVQLCVQIGTPFAEIAAVAKTLEADLIVIGTHGYTGLKHALLGSTAERVVRHAPCPVLVVRNGETKTFQPSSTKKGGL